MNRLFTTLAALLSLAGASLAGEEPAAGGRPNVVIRDHVGGQQMSHFHLPLLANKVEQRGDHFHCPGRLGVDVLVYPLGHPPVKSNVTADPLLKQ